VRFQAYRQRLIDQTRPDAFVTGTPSTDTVTVPCSVASSGR
jgi:hypothetical protein